MTLQPLLAASWAIQVHVITLMTLALAAMALYGARRHRRRLHRFAVIALYFGSLVFTGLVQVFLAPGITHRIFFSR